MINILLDNKKIEGNLYEHITPKLLMVNLLNQKNKLSITSFKIIKISLPKLGKRIEYFYNLKKKYKTIQIF